MIGAEARRALEKAVPGGVRFDAETARLTSLRVGGPADALAAPASRGELAALLAACREQALPVRVIGRGFNTLVRDEGVEGVVLQLPRLRALGAEGDGSRVRAEASVTHTTLTRFCRERGLAGLEFAAGIPGSVGGWVAMNAGVPGREMKDVVLEAEVLTASGEARTLAGDELGFAYRQCAGLPPGSVVVSALFGLSPSTPEAVGREVDELLAQRAERQPLDVPSCGSVFKNPPGGHAGALIDAAGLKGHCVGAAEISTTHANFIVNRGGASAADVLALVELARKTVREHTGVELETEVKVWGRSE